MFKRKKETSKQTQKRMRNELCKERLKMKKKVHYPIRKNLERIADNLENITFYMSSMKVSQDQQKQVVMGLSSICKNTFNENIRTQEVIDLIKQFFPEK